MKPLSKTFYISMCRSRPTTINRKIFSYESNATTPRVKLIVTETESLRINNSSLMLTIHAVQHMMIRYK